jgi:DNA-binding transcriptional regulator YiaG
MTDPRQDMLALIARMNLLCNLQRVERGARRLTPAQLREARLGLGLTQQQLADELDYDVKSINDWENGRGQMPLVAQIAVRFLCLDKDNVS